MTDFYCSNQASNAATAFQQSHAYTTGGNKMVPVQTDAGTNFALARQWVWECTTAGTSAAANPTWPASVTQDVTTVTSGGAVFTARRPGYSSGSTANWSFASPFFQYVLAAMNSGDRLFVDSTHSETSSTANVSIFAPAGSIGSNPITILSVSTGATPPTTLAAGAIVAATGNAVTSFAGSFYCYGMVFKNGVGAASSACAINFVNVGNNFQEFDTCEFWESSNSASAGFNFMVGSPSGSPSYCRWVNCKVKFANSGSGIFVGVENCMFRWEGGQASSGTTAITSLFHSAGGRSADVRVIGVDLSGVITSSGNLVLITNNFGGRVIFDGVVLPSAWSGNLCSGTFVGSQRVEMYNWDVSAGTKNYRLWRRDYGGDTVEETSITRVGGATDGTTPLTWKMTTFTPAYPVVRLESPEFAIWMDTTGVSKTLTVYVIIDANQSGGALTDKDMWIEAYVPTNTTPEYAFQTSRNTNPLSSSNALTTDSVSTWNNTGGMTTPTKQKMSITFTPSIKGWLIGKVCFARGGTIIAYVDPPTAASIT